MYISIFLRETIPSKGHLLFNKGPTAFPTASLLKTAECTLLLPVGELNHGHRIPGLAEA